MPISIEMTAPLPLEPLEDLLFITHSVWTDYQDDPFALIADYSDEDIRVFPARYNRENEILEPVSTELGDEIRAHIETNPIQVLTLEQIQEVLEDGQIQ